MLADGVSQSHTMRPLVGASSRHAELACGRGKWAVGLYEHGGLVVAIAHENKEWVYAQAEDWLRRK